MLAGEPDAEVQTKTIAWALSCRHRVIRCNYSHVHREVLPARRWQSSTQPGHRRGERIAWPVGKHGSLSTTSADTFPAETGALVQQKLVDPGKAGVMRTWWSTCRQSSHWWTPRWQYPTLCTSRDARARQSSHRWADRPGQFGWHAVDTAKTSVIQTGGSLQTLALPGVWCSTQKEESLRV
jgi:hypothetical protein